MRDVVNSALESDFNVSVRQLLVNVSDHVDSRSDELLGLLVDSNLEGWVPGSGVADSSSSDNSWVDEVFQNGIVDSSQGSVSWSHLRSVGLNSLGNDSPLANDEGGDALLLLNLDQELDDVLLSVGKRWVRNRDQNCLLATFLDGQFVCGGDPDVLELFLELGAGGSLVFDNLRNIVLKRGRLFLYLSHRTSLIASLLSIYFWFIN